MPEPMPESALVHRFGPYWHADGCLAGKSFREHGGIPRRFRVLIAAAYDSGIIGTENNGIVVVDEDRREVVLDQHCRQNSGFGGPSDEQRAEFRRIREMDWAAFSRFCREHPRYRGCMPDAERTVPDNGRAPQPDTVIFPEKDKPAEDCPYAFPLSTRREIVGFLSRHDGHPSDRDGFCLSWNIKVGDFDATGSRHSGEFNFDPVFDAHWKSAVEHDGERFWDACRDGLSQWTGGCYAVHPGMNEGAYEFSTAGRSGGHLVLTAMSGESVSFEGRRSFIEWLENLASDSTLVEMYRLAVCCDHDLGRPASEVEYQFACQRSMFEARRVEDRRRLVRADRAAIAAAESLGGRLLERNGSWHTVQVRCTGAAGGPYESEAAAARAYCEANSHQLPASAANTIH